MAGVGFKMSKSELNLSGSGCERAENEWQWVENEQKWVGVDGSRWEWVVVHESGQEHGLVQPILLLCFYHFPYTFRKNLHSYDCLTVKELDQTSTKSEG